MTQNFDAYIKENLESIEGLIGSGISHQAIIKTLKNKDFKVVSIGKFRLALYRARQKQNKAIKNEELISIQNKKSIELDIDNYIKNLIKKDVQEVIEKLIFKLNENQSELNAQNNTNNELHLKKMLDIQNEFLINIQLKIDKLNNKSYFAKLIDWIKE